jgi:hypothetical protein
MAEVISEIVGKEAYDQIKKLDEQLGDLVKKFENNTRAVLILEQALSNAKMPMDDLKKVAEELNKKEAEQVQIANDVVKKSEQKAAATKVYTNAINEQQKAELAAQQAASAWAGTGKQNVDTKNKLTKATRDLNKETAEEKLRLQQSTQELKNRIREESNAKGSLDNRRAALIRLRTEYDRLSPLERDTSWGQRMNKTIAQVDAQVLSLEKSTGRAQRNVGNYLNAAWSGIRQLAYIIPGLGIAGIFDVIATGIGMAVTKLMEYTAESKVLNEVRKKGVELSAQEVVKADILYAATQNLALSQKQRNNYVDELQKMYPNYFASLTNEEILAGKAAGAYNRLKDALVAAGIARATQDEMGSVMKELLQLELKNIEREEAIVKERQTRAQSQPSNVSVNGYSVTSSDAFSAGGVPNNADPDIERATKKEQEKYDKLLKILQKYQQKKADVEKSYADKSAKNSHINKGTVEDRKKEAEAYVHDLNELDREVQLMNEKTDAATIERIKKRLEEIKKINAKYAQDELDLIRENLAAQERDWEKFDKQRMDSLERYAQAISLANDLLIVIADIKYNKEMQAIDRRDKALENSYDLEKKQIEGKGLSQQQKEKELANLEARHESERKKIDRDRITAERKRAQFEKASNIANIVTTTALAVIKAYSEGDPYTKVARAGLAAAAGAINLARAVAAPIPQYAKGTDNHPGGPAIVGEQGIELGELPTGERFLTPGVATKIDLPAQTKIIPHDKTIAMLMRDIHLMSIRKMANAGSVNTDTMATAMMESFNELTKEMRGVKKEIRNLKLGVSLEGDMEHFAKMKNIIS